MGNKRSEAAKTKGAIRRWPLSREVQLLTTQVFGRGGGIRTRYPLHPIRLNAGFRWITLDRIVHYLLFNINDLKNKSLQTRPNESGIIQPSGLPLGLPLGTNMATRYPKAGKGSSWTVRELAAITPARKGDSLSDGDGLIGEVRVSTDEQVSVRFKYAFKWEGKLCWFQCGTWPKLGLSEIRNNRDLAKAKLKEGLNPSIDKKATKIEAQAAREAVIAEAEAKRTAELTIKNLFDDWVADGVARKDSNKELKRLFSKDVLPEIGDKEVRRLTDKDILALLRKMLARGVVRQVVIAFDDITQMLHWGEQRQPWRALLSEGNPANLIDIEKLLPEDYSEERDRVLSPAEIQELAAIFTSIAEEYAKAPAGTKYEATRPLKRETELAIWICLGTLCRIGELLMAEWRHVDLETGIWFIPKANVKGRRKQKQDHQVFLSDFAKRQFVELRALTGKSNYLFPSRNKAGEETHVCLKSVSKQIGDRQSRFKNRAKPLQRRRHDNTLVLSNGANEEWTPHDMRRTGATMMQQLRVPLDIIDRCQNHVLAGSKVRRHYLHYDYRDEKTEAWRKLGAELDRLITHDQSHRQTVSPL